jgi:hypothetical protein
MDFPARGQYNKSLRPFPNSSPIANMIEIDDYVPARRYLAPRTSSLWRWDEAAVEALVWTEGGTIAFRQELLPVLARLARRGLPPMNALVWLLGACREGWRETSNNLLAQAGLLASVDRCDLPDWLPQLMAQLDAVHCLPPELRTVTAAKAELAALVFEEAESAVGPEDSYRIVRVLADYREPGLMASQPGRGYRFADVLAELKWLHLGLQKFDAAAFRMRFETGIEQPIEPADVDLEPAERTRRLIARLQDDEELGGLARIARQMLAATQLPRAISDREDLPVGGVSDISNRGPLDRLVLSELAHDDLTLAVRVAMNEALYLRRETPPSNPPKHRAVLLDSGIRLWGVPRVFATAVGMALAAGGQRHVRTDVYRAAGDKVAPVSLADRAGLVAHMAQLEPDAHPGPSLAAFVATASAEEGLLDPVIVTAEDVAADRDFQKVLADLPLPAVLLATVSREGRFRLISHSRRGRKILREAALDLDKLLAGPARRRAPLIDPSVPAELPAILSLQRFPLLLAQQHLDPARVWRAPMGGLLSISKDRSLLYWQDAKRGARLLSDKAPAGTLHWTGSAPLGASLAVIGMLQQNALWLVRVTDVQCEIIALDLQGERPLAVCGHAGMVFVVYPQRIDVFETLGGKKVHTMAFTAGAWRRDRFFIRADQWFALSHDGFKPVFEPLLARGLRGREQILTFVDAPEIEGPIAILDDGVLLRPIAHTPRCEVNHGLSGPLKLVAVSRLGNAVLLSDASGTRLCEVSLRDGSSRAAKGFMQFHDEARNVGEFFRPQPVRNRFSRVFVDSRGRIGLISRKSEAVISLAAGGHIVMDSRRAQIPDKRLNVPFIPVAGPPGVGYSLRAARWQDGSTAWLDSRGMLHLKSSDRSLPEVTLVLRDGALAGWTSDGQTFGMAYFAGEYRLGTEAVSYDTIVQIPHVIAGRARLADGNEADIFNTILQSFVALLL